MEERYIDRDDEFFYEGKVRAFSKRGIIPLGELKEGDTILSLSTKGVLKKDKVDLVKSIDYNDELLYLSSHLCDLAVTPNFHSFFKKWSDGKQLGNMCILPYGFAKQKTIYAFIKSVPDCWKKRSDSDFLLIKSNYKVRCMDYARIMLWVKEFGKVRSIGKSIVKDHYVLTLPNSKSVQMKDSILVLKRVFDNIDTLSKHYSIKISSQHPLINDILSASQKKTGIPDKVKNLPIKSLQQVLEVYGFLNNASFRKKPILNYTDEKMKSDLCEICIKCGVSFKLHEGKKSIYIIDRFSSTLVKTVCYDYFHHKGKVSNVKLADNKIIPVIRNKDIMFVSTL